MTARLKFTATVQGVKVAVSKNVYDPSAGYAEVTFRIEAPKKPRPPMRSYRFCQADSIVHRLSNPDVELTKEQQKNLAAARKELAEEQRRFAEQEREYQQEMRALMPRLLAYAQVTGVVSLFGGQPVTLTVEPDAQDLLPGLDVMMLPAPADDEDLDLPEFDDEDLDDDAERYDGPAGDGLDIGDGDAGEVDGGAGEVDA